VPALRGVANGGVLRMRPRVVSGLPLGLPVRVLAAGGRS
jgi:hypothetical protein